MDVFDAAASGDLERVRAVVEQDPGLAHATNDDGWTPLLFAAYDEHVEVARYLFDHGATVNYRDRFQSTALHWACSGSHTDVVGLLLQRGADVTAVDGYGATPLMDAAGNRDDAVVRILLEHGGSDVDAADRDGSTACHHACIEYHAGVRQLLEAGADPTLRDADGRTASDVAAECEEHESVTIIQELGRAYLLQSVCRLCDAPSSTSQHGL